MNIFDILRPSIIIMY